MGHFSVEIYAPPGSTLNGNQQRCLLELPTIVVGNLKIPSMKSALLGKPVDMVGRQRVADVFCRQGPPGGERGLRRNEADNRHDQREHNATYKPTSPNVFTLQSEHIGPSAQLKESCCIGQQSSSQTRTWYQISAPSTLPCAIARADL